MAVETIMIRNIFMVIQHFFAADVPFCVFFLGHVPYTARLPKRHDFVKLLKVAARSTTGKHVSGSP